MKCHLTDVGSAAQAGFGLRGGRQVDTRGPLEQPVALGTPTRTTTKGKKNKKRKADKATDTSMVPGLPPGSSTSKKQQQGPKRTSRGIHSTVQATQADFGKEFKRLFVKRCLPTVDSGPTSVLQGATAMHNGQGHNSFGQTFLSFPLIFTLSFSYFRTRAVHYAVQAAVS